MKLKYRNKQNGQRRFIIDEGEKAIMHEGAKIYIENQELYIFLLAVFITIKESTMTVVLNWFDMMSLSKNGSFCALQMKRNKV